MNNIFNQKNYESLNILEDGTIQIEDNMDIGNLNFTQRRTFYLTRIGGISPLFGFLNFRLNNVKQKIKIKFDHNIIFDELEIYRLKIKKKNGKIELEMKVPKNKKVIVKKSNSLFKKYKVFHISKKN